MTDPQIVASAIVCVLVLIGYLVLCDWVRE
jgi:hypothetical protein